MVPAKDAEDIAKVKSDAQRMDLKLFISFLLVTSIYLSGAPGSGVATWTCQTLVLAYQVINLFGLSYFKARAIRFSRRTESLNSLNLNWLARCNANLGAPSVLFAELGSRYTDLPRGGEDFGLTATFYNTNDYKKLLLPRYARVY
jgi:hypothetical protein